MGWLCICLLGEGPASAQHSPGVVAFKAQVQGLEAPICGTTMNSPCPPHGELRPGAPHREQGEVRGFLHSARLTLLGGLFPFPQGPVDGLELSRLWEGPVTNLSGPLLSECVAGVIVAEFADGIGWPQKCPSRCFRSQN